MRRNHPARLIVTTLVAVAAGLAFAACGSGSSAANGSSTPSQSASATPAPVTTAQVVALVDTTCKAMEKDAAGTMQAIDDGVAPYKDPANPALYAFVYTPDITLIATPDGAARGQVLRGKPDATGKLFRDILVKNALTKGPGWIEYVYKQPDKVGLFVKSTYYKAVKGSDGKMYVVCAGRYMGTYGASPSPSPST